MDMDVKKRDSFMEMMNGVAKTHGCMIKFNLTPKDIHLMGITIQKQGWIQVFDIDWRNAKSQTEAATTVWAKFFSDFHENPADDYIKRDVEMTKAIGRYTNVHTAMAIKDVIFNDPATIVFWADGTKTVVKCQEGDEFDPEKGLTMAIAKKVHGNKGSYCNVIKKWVEPYYEKQNAIENQKIAEALKRLAEAATKAFVAGAALNSIACSAVAREIKLAEKKTEKEQNSTFKYDEPLFDTRGDAEKCINILNELIGTYGCATVADMYEASGIEDAMYYKMTKYGWTNIKDSKIYRTRHGYVIDLPKALPIETEESDA